MVPLGAGQVWPEVAPHHLRGEERHREALQDPQGEDQAVLQQPPIEQAGESQIVHELLHDVGLLNNYCVYDNSTWLSGEPLLCDLT